MRLMLCILSLLLCFNSVRAQDKAKTSSFADISDYSKYYEVDLDAPLPDIERLAKEMQKASEIYNPRYIVSWDMGPVFDKIWASTIRKYGTSEIRIKNPGEDDLLDMIKMLPKEYYPYIGPHLHASAGISEKILNLPGIKETKNQFPERIAPQLQGIEDLEFLSPHLYILLMPEMWPSNHKNVERPSLRPAKEPQVRYNPEFYAKILSKVPKQGFGHAARSDNQPGPDKLRTLNITKSSPLTSADIKAFVNTLDGIKKFSTPQNIVKIAAAGRILDYWEQKNGTALPINDLKDVVNPCQRLALKIKWAGLETEFSKNIAPQGFNLNEWAYTCDKTIKAYRVARIPAGKLSSLRAYKEGVYDAYLEAMNPKWKDRQIAALQSVVEMYKAPQKDILTVLKNESLIKDKIKQFGGILVTSPLIN